MAYKSPSPPFLPFDPNKKKLQAQPGRPPMPGEVYGIGQIGGSVQDTFTAPPPLPPSVVPPGYNTFGGAGSQVAPGEPGGGHPGNPPPPHPPGGGGGPGSCPPGQVWRDDAKGAYGSGNPGCEPEGWRSEHGQDTCLGAPPDGCLPQCTWCDFKDAQIKCDENCNNLGGYGGQGGHGGGGGKKGGGFLDPGQLASEELWKAIMARLNGETRYTPEVMSSLLGGVKTSAESQGKQLLRQSDADLALRGIARSGVAASAARDINQNTANQILQSKNAIVKAKIDADYQDKSQAIRDGLDWLNSLRDFVARMTATKAQKDAAMANIALGYARLQQELVVLGEEWKQKLAWWQLNGGMGLGF